MMPAFKKHSGKLVLLIVALTFLTYAVSLFNGFLGDDRAIFENNDFYKSFKNLPLIFSEEFIMDIPESDLFFPYQNLSFSGCQTYRPVVALSFFVDYFLWRGHPAGFHACNLFWHILAALLVFFLALKVTNRRAIALVTALLFATHPINSEAVNNIGYRSDILAAVFFLAAFFLYILTKEEKGRKRKILFLGSYLAFFLALFSKESAVVFPLMIIAYDLLFPSSEQKRASEKVLPYAGFLVILCFYLYIYLFVFPNANASEIFIWSQDLGLRLFVSLKIFYEYLVVFVFPFKVTVLPPLYSPPVESIRAHEILMVLGVLVASLVFIVRYRSRSKIPCFAMAWFLISCLPVANILPLANPFAFRFMYLPSVGFFIFAAVAIEKMAGQLQKRSGLINADGLTRGFVIAICMAVTVPHNLSFKNNFVVCRAMLKDYPKSLKPYWFLGHDYFYAGLYDKAGEYFRKYLQLNPSNPFLPYVKYDYFIHRQLGLCYLDYPDRAIAEFKKSVRLNPDFAWGYSGLAKAHIAKNDYKNSLDNALHAIRLDPALISGYIYAVHSLIELNRFEEAERLLKQAAALEPAHNYVVHYQQILKDKKN